MGLIMKNGIPYGGGGSGGNSASSRFIKDSTDENFGWIQCKDADGNWVNWIQAEKNGVLFSANNNAAEFQATTTYGYHYYLDPSIVTVGDVLTLKPDDSATLGNSKSFVMMSKKIDVTDYSKLIMEHTTTLPEVTTYTWAAFYVVDTLTGLNQPLSP